MKIKRFNENENVNNTKFYVYSVHPGDRTYRGSIWDSVQKKWIPDSAVLLAEFELSDYKNYIIVSQSELAEINKIKKESKIKSDSQKYNL